MIHEGFDISAPFFVYANVDSWQKLQLPDYIFDNRDLESFLLKISESKGQPFVFKLMLNSKNKNLTEIALGTGYYDQAHSSMISGNFLE
ncbi:MAG TPA: hypothetical protein PLR06_14655 [Cyclobacteriaceae bacterium]|nr:hypothetical protein [Cyclobacteriaceae bacterium]